jgi:CMP-N,N'-diacetyllegionaminic acid synthase
LINGQTVLAVIPARSGSKRCPGKNFRLFRGKVLFEWSVDAAKGSRYIDTIKLSLDTDRPPELCTDDAMNEDVLRYELARTPHDLVVLLQPTSPLRTAGDIDACLERVAASDVNLGCISYSEGNWQKNGAVYVARREWIEKHDFGHTGLLKYWMPEERSLDIDYAAQFE